MPQDPARDGVSGWLPHFRRDASFFMASDGDLVFSSNAVADSVVAIRATTLRAIDLRWMDSRIDSLTPDSAVFAARFTEALADSSGQVQNIHGYFTAVAERQATDWQFRNLHWSLAKDGE
ncbi:MAG: nuclear transport factor 2 family protein [Gemmatimonadota bacterium]